MKEKIILNWEIKEKVKETISNKKIIKEIYWIRVEFSFDWIKIWKSIFLNHWEFDSSFNKLSMIYLLREIIEKNFWYWDIVSSFLYFEYDFDKQIPSVYDLMMIEKLYFVFSFNDEIFKFEDWKFTLIWNLNELINSWKIIIEEILWWEEIEIKLWNRIITNKKESNQDSRKVKTHIL